jgi:hypothetical protein
MTINVGVHTIQGSNFENSGKWKCLTAVSVYYGTVQQLCGAPLKQQEE